MPQKFLKPGKTVVVLNGRFAGKKAVILKNFDEGEKSTSKYFGCALIVGIERAPLKVTKSMDDKKIARRSRIKTFMKMVNYNHLMPTRYSLDVAEQLKQVALPEILADPAKKKEARLLAKKLLEERYKTGQNKWFFSQLRF
jgi:ribosomal protein L14E/L6E/L27E